MEKVKVLCYRYTNTPLNNPDITFQYESLPIHMESKQRKTTHIKCRLEPTAMKGVH